MCDLGCYCNLVKKPCRPAQNPLPPNFAFGFAELFPAYANEKGDDMGREVGVGVPKFSTFLVRVV
jgi:hypothetical protein